MPDDLPAPIAHAPSQAIGDLLMLDVRRLRILHAVNEYGSVTPGASSRSAGVVATVSPRSGSSSTPWPPKPRASPSQPRPPPNPLTRLIRLIR